jgi:hypothetical protein
MDKLQLTGWNLGRVFNYSSDRMFVIHLFGYEAIQPNLKLKTRPKQLLGYLPLAFALPRLVGLPSLVQYLFGKASSLPWILDLWG